MKTRTKLFAGVLIGCALVLAFTACAGCIADDSSSVIPIKETPDSSDELILGAWKHNYNNGNACYYLFNPDGTYTITVKGTDSVKKFNLYWQKVSDTHYQTALGLDDFYLNSDGTQFTLKVTGDDGKIEEEVYVRVSLNEVPAETTATVTKTSTPTPTATVTKTPTAKPTQTTETKYVVNLKTKKVHKSTCRYVKDLDNFKFVTSTDGYEKCKVCF